MENEILVTYTDMEYVLLCKDKDGIIRQVLIQDSSVEIALRNETIIHGAVRVLDKPIEGLTWGKRK